MQWICLGSYRQLLRRHSTFPGFQQQYRQLIHVQRVSPRFLRKAQVVCGVFPVRTNTSAAAATAGGTSTSSTAGATAAASGTDHASTSASQTAAGPDVSNRSYCEDPNDIFLQRSKDDIFPTLVWTTELLYKKKNTQR